MIRFYTPILLLQMFCLYHAYTSNTERKWFWIIIIFPVIGSLIYLYDTFYTKRNIDNLSEGVKNAFIGNYKIDKLEKQLKYSDTVSNKIELADEHALVGNYDRALTLYKSCLNGVHKDDSKLLIRIMNNSYLQKDYKSAIHYGEQIVDEKVFNNSEEKLALAWSYYHDENFDLAEEKFKEMDIRFSNYKQRLAYSNFLKLTSRPDECSSKLQNLIDEIDSMDNYEKRSKKKIYKEIKNMSHQLST